MKFLLVLIPILFLSACTEREIEAYDDLDQAEQDEIRNRGRQQCLEKLTPTYEKFKVDSAQVFSSTGYDRGKGFLYEFAGGSVKKTLDVKIWKRTPLAIYFYISSENEDDYFLKLSRVENELIIDALLDAHCLRPEIYTSTINSSNLTMKNEYVLPKAPNREKFIDTYSMPFNSLAAFANFRISRTRATFDVNDTQIDTTTQYTSTRTSKEYTFNSTDPFSSEYNQKFCIIDDSNNYRFPKERGVEGFKYNCTNTADPVIWDLAIP